MAIFVLARAFVKSGNGLYDDRKICVLNRDVAEGFINGIETGSGKPIYETHEVSITDPRGRVTHIWDPDSNEWMTPEQKVEKEREDV